MGTNKGLLPPYTYSEWDRKSKGDPMDDILSQVIEFQREDDYNLRNDFINQYKPFILSSVSKSTGMYVRSEDSDEFSVGLEAFNEAIDKYEAEKGSFIAFAGLVIRSRVTDYLRKENRYHGSVESNEEILLNTNTRVNEDLVAEVTSFKNALSHFGISMELLADEAPKHEKTKREVIGLGKNISENEIILKRLYESKKLPMAAIMKVYKTTKKRLKTYRNYIIGVVIIFKERLDIMKTYLAVRGEHDESGNHH